MLGKDIKRWTGTGRDGPRVHSSGWHELLIHPAGMNAEVILWLWKGVLKGREEKGVRHTGSTPACLEAGQRIYSFIYSTNIYSALTTPDPGDTEVN